MPMIDLDETLDGIDAVCFGTLVEIIDKSHPCGEGKQILYIGTMKRDAECPMLWVNAVNP